MTFPQNLPDNNDQHLHVTKGYHVDWESLVVQMNNLDGKIQDSVAPVIMNFSK